MLSRSSSLFSQYDRDAFEQNAYIMSSYQKPRGYFTNCSPHRLRAIDTEQDFKLKQNLFTNVNPSEERKLCFFEVYENWLKAREETLEKLRSLLDDLHNDQLGFNKVQIACRQTGCFSRQMKSSVQSKSIDFVASIAAFLSDASSSIVSVAQAVNIENYLAQFQEIVDQDAMMTKRLYEARSECIAEYSGIEEVFRKFQVVTFDSTLSEVTNILEVDKLLIAVENAYRSNNMEEVLRLTRNFVDKGYQSDMLYDVSKLLQGYVSSNPAALDACKSAGRAVYGVLDTFGLNKNSVAGSVRYVSNNLLIDLDKDDIAKLQSTVTENFSQSQLEEKILDSIDTLTSEMNEISNAYLLQQDREIDNTIFDS